VATLRGQHRLPTIHVTAIGSPTPAMSKTDAHIAGDAAEKGEVGAWWRWCLRG
jgi:hypothetical protein